MRDLDERLPRILDDLAGEIRPDPALRDRVIGRSRRRRALTSATTVLVALGLIAGGVVGSRSILDAPGQTIGGDGPSPSAVEPTETFAGIWPETDAKSLAVAQAAADDGHQPWRTDAAFTAAVLTVDLFGWAPDAAETTMVAEAEGTAIVELRNPAFAEHVTPIVIELKQLGVVGPSGVWSVVAVSSDLIELTWAYRSTGEGDPHVFSGRLTDVYEGAGVQYEVLGGATPDAPAGIAQLDGREFLFEVPPTTAVDGRPVLWVQVVEATGAALGATAVPLNETTAAGSTGATGATGGGAGGSSGSAGSGGTHETVVVPEVVARTRDAILQAALAHDVDTLRTLLDPNTFAYNFGDGSDPTPEWAADPTVLDTLAAILQMPPAIRHTEESGDFYVWPYFLESDLTSLTPEEYALLETIGISQADVRGMIEFGSYIGPRTTIAPDGTWLNYALGGD